jgi:hypothetical protein
MRALVTKLEFIFYIYARSEARRALYNSAFRSCYV